jgi:y4mF family transcriptional regulator
MKIRTPADLGAVVRDRRRQLKLDQAGFAQKIGVSRKWVIEIERGHSRAELGLVLRALDALDLTLDATTDEARRGKASPVDIDAIIAKAKKGQP